MTLFQQPHEPPYARPGRRGRSAEQRLAALPPDAEGHLRLHVYAVLARFLGQIAEDEDQPAELSFLDSYRTALQDLLPLDLPPRAAAAWWDEQIDRWEARVDRFLPLRAIVDDLGLSRDAQHLLVAAGLVEEDIRFGALFAAIQEPLAGRRPCVGALSWLLGVAGGSPFDAAGVGEALVERGLLVVENRADPRLEWLLRVPPAIWDAVHGRRPSGPIAGLVWQPASSFPDLADLILPEALVEQVGRLPRLLDDGQVDALVLRGMAGTGRRTVAGSLARALGRDVLLAESVAQGDEAWRLLGPLATLTRSLPVVRCDPGPGETATLPALPGYRGPVALTLGRGGGLGGPLVERALTVSLPPPDRAARWRFWTSTSVPMTPADCREIVDRFLLTGGNIRRVAALGAAQAAVDGRETVTPADVQQASRALNRQVLDTLATPLEPASGWVDVVVGAGTSRDLQALEARCRSREELRERAGVAFASSLNRGVRALFSGPSGTGKSLAARALAAALKMDVYRVDLAAVVNKYIGETERNLNQVLSRAEELDVVLLLDEGDALMTGRTEVRNANDRYANLETNYLLQRLETFEGIVVVTTNAGQRIDAAFQRRLDAVVDFTPPEATERWLIWDRHLPHPNAVSQPFLEEVVVRCQLTGGQIRNAALQATLLALADGGVVEDRHLAAAIRREYRKAGALCPLASEPPRGTATASQVQRLQRFAAELA